MSELDSLLSSGVTTTPRTLTGKGREQWNEAVEKLAKGEGRWGAHGAQKKLARHFKEEYNLTCTLRTIENSLHDEARAWRAKHG